MKVLIPLLATPITTAIAVYPTLLGTGGRYVLTFSNSRHCSFYRFEPLTLIPMQKKLLDLTLLSPKELDWLDAYHNTVS